MNTCRRNNNASDQTNVEDFENVRHTKDTERHGAWITSKLDDFATKAYFARMKTQRIQILDLCDRARLRERFYGATCTVLANS